MFRIETNIADKFIVELIKKVFNDSNSYLKWHEMKKPKSNKRLATLLIEILKERSFKVVEFKFNEKIHEYILEME